MKVRLHGSVAVVTPIDQRSLDADPEALERELWLQCEAGRSVVIDGSNLRHLESIAIGILIGLTAKFQRAGRRLIVVMIDKHVQSQIKNTVQTDLSVETAIASIERAPQSAASA